jgi:hypothetical protein
MNRDYGTYEQKQVCAVLQSAALLYSRRFVFETNCRKEDKFHISPIFRASVSYYIHMYIGNGPGIESQ